MKNFPRPLTRPIAIGAAGVLGLAALFAVSTDDSTRVTSPSAATHSDDADHTPDHVGNAHYTADHAHTGHDGHTAAGDTVVHAAAMALVDPARATHTAVSSGPWSDPATWGGELPATGSHVHIPSGVDVTVDAMLEPEIETIGVDGTLRFAPVVDTELKVDTLVTSPHGTLEVGTPDRPISDDVTASIVFADDGPIDRSLDPSLLSRGALLHGRTVVHGATVTHRATVATFPRSGDTSIEMVGELAGWDAGDEIVITGTAGPTSDERRVITAVDGSTVRFAEPLALDHVPPAADLDLYVANLTRNVRFSSETDDVTRRGHVMIMHTLDAHVSGARFTDLGRTDKSRELDDVEFADIEPGAVGWDGTFETLGGTNVRGRYSIHIHRGGADPRTTPAVIADSVVTGDPGWAFTNHSSHVDFVRNVAYDNAGAGFFTEAGDETGRWIDNIAIRTVMPGFSLDDGDAIDPDLRADRQDFGVDGDGFWLQGNRVDLIGNVAAGSSAHGIIWWSESLAEADLGAAAMVDVSTLPDPSLVPDREEIQVWWAPLGEVRDNTSYGATIGIRARYIHGASYLEDPDSPPAAYIETLRPTIDGVTIWDVRDGVLMNYNERLTLRNIRAIGNAYPFHHNHGATAAVGVGLDVGNDATFGPGLIENIDLRNFEVGVIGPRHGAWEIRNVTTAATTDVLLHSPFHTERSLDMTDLTFAPLDDTDLADREAERRHVVLAYEYAGDGDGVDPSTAEADIDEEGATIGDRVTWDGRGLYSHADTRRPSDAVEDPNVINGLVGDPAPAPEITHVPGAGAIGGDDFEDEEFDEKEFDGDEDVDDDEGLERDEFEDDESADEDELDAEIGPAVVFEGDSVEAVTVDAIERIRQLLAGGGEDLSEIDEWCAVEAEGDDPFVLVCAALAESDGVDIEETGRERDDDDLFDAVDRVIEGAADRIEELVDDDPALGSEVAQACDSSPDVADPATFVCSILDATGDDD